MKHAIALTRPGIILLNETKLSVPVTGIVMRSQGTWGGWLGVGQSLKRKTGAQIK